ncbi:MAG TPA: RNA polymerase subunit sigma-24, partial [Alphaproteobacteria bacterium]|nr:RNA polymerase subunit sigma-24 [Alphaproteobacteria bacterium]
AWLVSAGRFKAIDRIRRRARHAALVEELARDLEEAVADEPMDAQTIVDDQLRLIFACCHPALAPDAQVALALREICGLTTEQIAAAFLVPAPTLAQRIVRAKARIREARLPYVVPDREALPERLEMVLHAIYLVFNEGYSAPAGGADLAAEAIRLGRLLVELLPEPEALGLLGLMLLNESRRGARLSPAGETILIGDQDRSRWNRDMIGEGAACVRRALESGRAGTFVIQAAIALHHAEAPSAEATDWAAIARWYDALIAVQPTPVVALNRAVAVAMRDGAEAGLAIIEALLADGALSGYHLAHAARADLCRRLGRPEEARRAYESALGLARDEADRRFLRRRLAELG